MTASLVSLTPPVIDDDSEWRSVRNRTVGWDERKCDRLATYWFEDMLAVTKTLIAEERFLKNELVALDNKTREPKKKHVQANYFWLKSLVRFKPGRPEGIFFIADALLALHRKCNYKLFKPGTESKAACKQATKMRRLWGALRSVSYTHLRAHET